jgi:hypothetical protein
MTIAWRRLLRMSLLGVGFLIGAYFAWHWISVFRFYRGPSEATLAETGFDWTAAKKGQLPQTFEFAPTYPFWSDGARKERFIQIPANSRIDTSNPDRWNFPVGTRIWKVFVRDDVHVETRMLFKHGPEPWEWDMAVYQPGTDPAVARKLALAKENVADTAHDIPAPMDCVSCHGNGKTRRPLGVTAIQLPWSSDETLSLRGLIDADLLTVPPVEPYIIPGDPLTRAALGYFDTNCGSCHHQGSTFVTDKVQLKMNLTTDTLTSVASTYVYRSAVGREPHLSGLGTSLYIVPGAPSESFLWRRMALRDSGGWQMPPLATEVVDEEGVSLIEGWILSLKDSD